MRKPNKGRKELNSILKILLMTTGNVIMATDNFFNARLIRPQVIWNIICRVRTSIQMLQMLPKTLKLKKIKTVYLNISR